MNSKPQVLDPNQNVKLPSSCFRLWSTFHVNASTNESQSSDHVLSTATTSAGRSTSRPPLLGLDLRNQSKTETILTRCRSIISQMRYEHLAAGLTGGVVSTLVLHPLDLLKIRLAGNSQKSRTTNFFFELILIDYFLMHLL